MDKRGLKRKVVMVQLRVLGILGIYVIFGCSKIIVGGVVLAYFEYAKPSMENFHW